MSKVLPIQSKVKTPTPDCTSRSGRRRLSPPGWLGRGGLERGHTEKRMASDESLQQVFDGLSISINKRMAELNELAGLLAEIRSALEEYRTGDEVVFVPPDDFISRANAAIEKAAQ